MVVNVNYILKWKDMREQVTQFFETVYLMDYENKNTVHTNISKF
jgi:hypothetical protein